MSGIIVKHAETVARRKIDAADGWEWFRVEMVDDGIVKLTGGVPTVGPKGKKKWPKLALCRASYVTEAEVVAERERYERETGKCGGCFGETREWTGWSLIDGNRYRECRDCAGTGTATVRTSPSPDPTTHTQRGEE
jgi:hypothetical protein